ncbi:diacylglycerol kinase family protein [Fodinicola acaciae]|uniref:diacylglycerol kinase family protein n=1 Tax=Fodinicola acaciae TaxID=2681555 RepID=UPI001C9E5156|nr:diacylglycerol kinase family protein [Fodinicola acaciae]
MTSETAVMIIAPGPGTGTRVPVLRCADALRKHAEVTIREVDSPADANAALADADGRRLVVAGSDDEIRAVLRQLVRRVVPKAGDRTGIADNRTIPDLPPLGLLPLDGSATDDLVAVLGLPREPEAVAAAVRADRTRRLDLLRHDGGSVTVHAALLGGRGTDGLPAPWTASVTVDDTVLCQPDEMLLAVGVTNAGRLEALPGLALTSDADPADGALDVAVAVPVRRGRWPRKPRTEVEVRRFRGRAVAITPSDVRIPALDDGAEGVVSRKRTWWVEPSAWAVYTG